MSTRAKGDQGPRMREAYPQLDIIEAMSALSRDETLCLFQEDPNGAPQGLLEFGVTPDMSQASLDGFIAMRPPWQGPMTLDLVPNPNGVQRNRRVTLCPQCERRCQVLTWVGSWRCRACDGRLARRQLIGRDTRKAEELAALETQLEGGRRKGQHQAVFDRLTAQAEQLARELDGCRPRMAAPEHRVILHREWISIDEYHRRGASVNHLPVPSEERQRRLEQREAERLREARTRPAAEASRMSFDSKTNRRDDPDEVSPEDM